MKTYSVDIELDDEYDAALEGLRSDYDPELTAQQYLAVVLRGAIAGRVAANYSAALSRIGEAAKALPFEARVQLIQQIESQLTP
jgi:hypothetical protein